MFYGKGEGGTGIFQNSVEVHGDYQLRALAQGKNREAQIQMNLESDSPEHIGCEQARGLSHPGASLVSFQRSGLI